MKYCTIKGCVNQHLAKGLCSLHYQRVRSSTVGVKKYSPQYYAWIDMKQRCYNPRNKGYKNYGERGIKVCDEWLHDFDAFLDFVGIRPDHTTLDRIDNNGNYEPGNVHWATYSHQNLNKRIYSKNISGVKGITFHNGLWRVDIRINHKQKWVGNFIELQDAKDYLDYITQYSLQTTSVDV